jgi:hypothetical protein
MPRWCPYLEELLKERHGPLRVYRFDCHVDRRSKRKLSLRGIPPICVRQFEECHLYDMERARENRNIDRYID